VLGLYDPDRPAYPSFRDPTEGPKPATWDDFEHWWSEVAGLESKFDASGGRGLVFVIGRRSSPSINAVRRRVEQRWPNAVFVVHEPSDVGNAQAGSVLAFGSPHRERLVLDKAQVVFSLDRDFLNTASPHEPDSMRQAREFASMRRPMSPKRGSRRRRLR